MMQEWGKFKETFYAMKRWFISLRWFFYGLAAIAFSHLIQTLPHKWGSHFFGKVLEHVGVAVLIALFIGWMFDRIHQEKITEFFVRMLEEFKDNAFTSVYKWSLPQEFIDAVHEQIFSTKLVRESWNAEYVLRDFKGDEKEELITMYGNNFPFERRLVVDALFTGSIENKSTSTISSPLTYMIEKEDAAKFNNCTLIKVTDSQGNNIAKYEGNELKNLLLLETNSEDLKNKLSINNIFKTPDIKFSPNSKYNVTVIWKCVRSRLHAREVMSIMSLTHKIKITVEPRIPGLSIYGELLSPYSFKSEQQGDKCLLTSNKPNLPHQGYMIWWHSGAIDPANSCAVCTTSSSELTTSPE